MGRAGKRFDHPPPSETGVLALKIDTPKTEQN
jgi:hypothetical protein